MDSQPPARGRDWLRSMLGVTAEYLCGCGFLGGLVGLPGSSDGQRVTR